MAPHFSIRNIRFFHQSTSTRFPFQYGIASMTAAPHVLVRAEMDFHGRRFIGQAAEGLPPKWFTKNSTTLFEQDLPDMVSVIQHAADAVLAASRPQTFFQYWQEMYDAQVAWAAERKLPPLLANLGVALVERALLDGLCRMTERPLHAVLLENLLGLQLGAIRHELAGMEPASFLPAAPKKSFFVRHTVGLGDPIDESDPVAAPDDQLPFTLEDNISAYGLRYFKIKLSGQYERDQSRLERLARVLPVDGKFTVDGNENFPTLDEFRDQWERHLSHPQVGDWLRSGLLFVEQPLHRDTALAESMQASLAAWSNRPSIIIDEADGSLADLEKALELGYSGVSHKNCKGIVKGLANAATIHARNSETTAGRYVLSGEDLANLGPVALLQDCAMMSSLGLSHVERNGHHYFRGLSAWPKPWQADTVASHPDLYQWRQDHAGEPYASLKISQGTLSMLSVNEAPFGCKPRLDPMEILEPGLPQCAVLASK